MGIFLNFAFMVGGVFWVRGTEQFNLLENATRTSEICFSVKTRKTVDSCHHSSIKLCFTTSIEPITNSSTYGALPALALTCIVMIMTCGTTMEKVIVCRLQYKAPCPDMYAALHYWIKIN